VVVLGQPEVAPTLYIGVGDVDGVFLELGSADLGRCLVASVLFGMCRVHDGGLGSGIAAAESLLATAGSLCEQRYITDVTCKQMRKKDLDMHSHIYNHSIASKARYTSYPQDRDDPMLINLIWGLQCQENLGILGLTRMTTRHGRGSCDCQC